MQIHGVTKAVTLDLAGVGLCAKTNLEELFNYTMQKVAEHRWQGVGGR